MWRNTALRPQSQVYTAWPNGAGQRVFGLRLERGDERGDEGVVLRDRVDDLDCGGAEGMGWWVSEVVEWRR